MNYGATETKGYLLNVMEAEMRRRWGSKELIQLSHKVAAGEPDFVVFNVTAKGRSVESKPICMRSARSEFKGAFMAALQLLINAIEGVEDAPAHTADMEERIGAALA